MYGSVSLAPQALWKLREVGVALEAETLEVWPDSRLLGRYCKVLIGVDEYQSKSYMRVIRYMPLNPHITSVAEMQEEERLHEVEDICEEAE